MHRVKIPNPGFRRLRSRALLRGLVFAVVLGIVTGACSEDTEGIITVQNPDAVNILFIGNSLTYANDLPGMLLAMLTAAGIGAVQVEYLAFPNWGLQDHWGIGEARNVIARGGWDLIILQQGPSATEGRPSLLEYSARFKTIASTIGADIALYMVWPSKARSFDFDGVSNSYGTAAENNNGLLFPAGEAWRAAWAVNSALPFYAQDNFHPSEMGSYLAALTMYEQISGNPAGTVPATLALASGKKITFDAAVLSTLRAAASKANADFGRTVEGWPVGSN
ncbi:hypothetical protein ACFL3H_07760 [Gemmatimonadota bacterium]